MEKYRWTILQSDKQLVKDFQVAAGISRPSAVALVSNGLAREDLDTFLQPRLNDLVDPYELPGAYDAARRIWEAIKGDEKILIHGDYDADGITSTVLVKEVLTRNGARVESFLPHRMDDGYGLTPESIEKACGEHHQLLITVDCGITSHAAVETARKRGIDVIITDHHEPGDTIPEADIVIDPKLESPYCELRELAGVGVAFKLCHAFVKYGRQNNLGDREYDLKEVLDLVALGTVADIVPLLQENRRLVKAGLAVLSRQHRPGVRALCDLVRLDETVRSPDIAFRLAPRLNAAGRMGDATLSLKLLESKSMQDAVPLAKQLNHENRQRQEYETATYKDARNQIRQRGLDDSDFVIVVADADWHQGVLGIVASRLVRDYYRPCIVLGSDASGAMCGSGRSVPEVNLVKMLANCSDLLMRYGGHPMAAGLSIEPDKVETLRQCLNTSASKAMAVADMCPQLKVSGESTFREIVKGFLTELDILRPFGQGNPEPVFYTRGVLPDSILPAGRDHTRGRISDPRGDGIDYILFGAVPGDLPPAPWDIAYRAQINTYRGRSSPQAQILDIKHH
ncbi:MAG: single-stranded-DNA-specific exonuclease RecJ [Lentisphaeria bacterium]